MLALLNDSMYLCGGLIMLLLIWKVILFVIHQKRLRFTMNNFFWYSKISISGTYSDTAKKAKLFLNRISLAIVALLLVELLLVFVVLAVTD